LSQRTYPASKRANNLKDEQSVSKATAPQAGRRFDPDAETLDDLIMSITDEFQGSPYDQIGLGYTSTRRPDPRIAVQIHEALGDARSIVNVGAGAGAYEPCDREVLPIEPSERMIAQRPPELAAAQRGYAESLPLAADSVDAAMACMTLHHWADWRIGVQELRRVARKRVVIFTYDHTYATQFWLLRDYLPKLARLDCARFPAIDEQRVATGDEVRVEPVPIPHDCEDGFLAAYWRRPAAYLDERVRSGMSAFRLPGAGQLLDGLEVLADDLRTGRWEDCNHDILEREELDLGYRLLVAEL
jgi:SAM-dependent methyltransferase